MLPFLSNKDKKAGVAGLIVKSRTPDEKPESDQDDDPKAAMKACMASLIASIHAHDVEGACEAVQDLFEVLESQPHDEESAETPSPHSYDAQKD